MGIYKNLLIPIPLLISIIDSIFFSILDQLENKL